VKERRTTAAEDWPSIWPQCVYIAEYAKCCHVDSNGGCL